MGGGQDKPAWTACPPGVKITRVGGKITRDSLPPGGQAVQGGKINCYTGSIIDKNFNNYNINKNLMTHNHVPSCFLETYYFLRMFLPVLPRTVRLEIKFHHFKRV